LRQPPDGFGQEKHRQHVHGLHHGAEVADAARQEQRTKHGDDVAQRLHP